MRTVTKTYRDGEVIYRQGEESRWAFEVLEGSVELIKDSAEGSTVVSRLKAGELFGELGILDNAPRSTSARARGAVTVKAIPRDEFLRQVEADPDTALKVMTKLARRMRGSDTDPVRAAAYKSAASNLPVPVAPPESSILTPVPVRVGRPLPQNLIGERKLNFIEKIFDAVAKEPHRRSGKKAKSPTPGDVLVMIAKLRDDFEDVQHKAIVAALDGIPGVRCMAIDRDLSRFVPGLADPAAIFNDDTMRRATREGRSWMSDKNADLLIWGNIDPTGRNIELHFIATASSPGERPGRFTPLNVLTVPVDFYTDWAPLIRAVVLAASDPRSFSQGRILRSALPALAANARPIGLEPPPNLEPGERASILFCYGNVCAICAQLEGDRSWYHGAVEAWRAAIDLIHSDQGPLLGQLYQQLGLSLQIIAERAGDSAWLEQAAETYRRALIHISRRKQPADWGLVKYRLGCVLYKVDLAIGDDNALREAIHACQAARQVFNKYSHPIRWSEISNTLAQILQVYGDNARSIPILEYAVKSCLSSLQVRTPDTAPLQWASIQNTLGSALFLLAKHTGEWEYMRQSSDAFRLALTVYKEHGAGRMAVITERNLLRAEKQVQASAGKHATDPVWAQNFNITEEDSYDWQAFLEGAPQANDGDLGGMISEVA
ncbi:MAG: cyclic nucleotide-binding domain-containing protein [Candidatus Binataceae bacterium]